MRLTVYERLRERFPELQNACIGFYWPFKGEIDLRHLIGDFLALGAEAALPVVVEKKQPLEFWSWHPYIDIRQYDPYVLAGL